MIVSSVPDRPVQTRTTGARAARERERETTQCETDRADMNNH